MCTCVDFSAKGASRFPASVVVARRPGRYVAVLQGRFQDPAAVELAYRGAIDLLPGRAALRYWGDTFLLAAFDLFVGHEHVAAPGAQVDADHITGAQPRQAAARGALGRGVEDRGAVRCSGLPAVADGWQRVDAALDERVGGLHVDHFGGAGPPDGPSPPDHQDRVLVDAQLGIVDAVVVVVGAVEDDRAALEDAIVAQVALAELLGDHARLYDREVEEVAREDHEPGALLQRLVVGRDHLAVRALAPCNVLGQRPPRDGQDVAVDLARLQELVEDGGYAAGAVEALAEVFARGLHVDQQRHIVTVVPVGRL